MKTGKIVTLVILGILAILAWTLFSDYRDVYDKNVHLHSEYEAQNQVIEEVHGNMIAVIKTKAHISDQYADKIKDIFVPIIEGRYSKGDGSLMKWVQEQNPNFDPSLYKDLMESVEALRTDFLNSQIKMTAIIQQHNNLRNEFWAHLLWLRNEPALKYIPISPSETKETMKTRVDDFDPYSSK